MFKIKAKTWILWGALCVTTAEAQQKPAKPDKAESAASAQPKADETDNQTEPASQSQDGTSEQPTAGDDLGPPPPRGTTKPEKVRPSPLTPKPEEFPEGKSKPAPAEYDKLLSDIAALRSRVAALTTTLYKSKLRIIVATEGDNAQISNFVVTLDDGVVYTAPARFVADDEKTVYEHAVAPGHHVIGVEIERTDARGKEYKTWQSSRFSVVVPDSETLEAEMLVEDDSDIAVDFPDDADGEYELGVRLRARVTEP